MGSNNTFCLHDEFGLILFSGNEDLGEGNISTPCVKYGFFLLVQRGQSFTVTRAVTGSAGFTPSSHLARVESTGLGDTLDCGHTFLLD